MRSLRIRALAHLGMALAVFGGSLVFYLATGPNELAWGEGADYQRRIALAEIGGGPWDRPLFILLSQPFQILGAGSPAERASLAAAVFAAGACLLVYLLMKHLLLVAPQFIARRVGLLTALTLAVSHTFWLRAVTPGPEPLDALILAGILYLLLLFVSEGRAPFLYLAVFLLGLSLANNLFFVFLVPVFAAYVRIARPPLIRDAEIGRVRARALAVFGLGLFVAVGVAGWGWASAGDGVPGGKVGWLAFWRPESLALGAGLAGALGRFGTLLLYNFPPWIALVGLLGLLELFKRQKYVFWLIFALLGVSSAAAVLLKVPDPALALVPCSVLLALVVGYGWWKVLAEARWVGFALALVVSVSPVALYHLAPAGVSRLGEEVRIWRLFGTSVESPLDPLSVNLNPDRRLLPDARSFAGAMIESLPEHAQVYMLSRPGELLVAPARYLVEVEGQRPSVRFRSSPPGMEENLEGAFLAGLHPPHSAIEGLLERHALSPAGYLFRVDAPGSAGNGPAPVDGGFAGSLAGEWYGTVLPQGYRLRLSVEEGPGETYAGRAILNDGGANALEGAFTRLSLIGESILGQVSFRERVDVQLDGTVTGDRVEGTWRVFEAPSLAGRFQLVRLKPALR